MNDLQENRYEKRKVIAFVISVIFSICAGFSTYIIWHGQNDIAEKISLQEKSIRSLGKVIEKSVTVKYKTRIKSFLNLKVREEIIKAFAQQDRPELLRLSNHFYDIFKKEDKYFSSFAWFLPSNHVFLRIPKPKMFGDDISLIRPDIVKANSELQVNSGYLTAYSGLDYRVVQPVIYHGQHLGSVQFGLNGYFIIDMIKKELGITVAQVMPVNKFKLIKSPELPHFISGSLAVQTRELDLFKSSSANIDWNLDRQKIIIKGKDYIISKVFELPNYDGKPEGLIFVLLDISELTAGMRNDIITVIFISIILVFLSSFFISRSYDKLIGKIAWLNHDLSQKNSSLEEQVKARTLELHNEREQLFVTLRSIGDGVITTDINGKIVLINKITEQLTGWSQQEAVGRPVQDVFNIINEQTGKPCENPVEKVLTTGQVVVLANHTVLISKNGTKYIIEDSGAPIFDKDSKIIGTVLVYRDATEEKRTANELVKIKKLESVGVLAGGIAHDFNNILSAILGNIELAVIYTDPTNEAYPLLKEATKASLRAKGLTQQLLTFSTGGEPIKQTSAIGQIITDSADFVLHGSSVLCHYNIPDDLWQVNIDAGQISQVIQNIIINARHAMPEGGVIEVSCQNLKEIKTSLLQLPTGKYIKIKISDSGSGIPKKYLEKIFDPYFSTKQEGSGLGLAICYSIISKHDGNIAVESEANKGTIFTIYLPASQNANQEAARIKPTLEAKQTNKATIMVMDDDSMVRNMVKQILERSGHEVLQAENGHEAVEQYNDYLSKNHSIDIIIMDLTIPGGMGGKETVPEILKINPDAKVIVASGYSNDPVMARYQDYGFVASIAKPFQLAELNELIDEIIQ